MEKKDLSQREVLVRMIASVLMGYSTLEGLDGDERDAEEADVMESDAFITDAVRKYASQQGKNGDEMIKELGFEANELISSGQYDQEVMEMLIEEGEDVSDYFDKTKLN